MTSEAPTDARPSFSGAAATASMRGGLGPFIWLPRSGAAFRRSRSVLTQRQSELYRMISTQPGADLDLGSTHADHFAAEPFGKRIHAAQAHPRQQGLFVVVAEALDPARAFQDPVRGTGDPDGPARHAREHAQIRADRKMPVAAGRQDRGLGVARDHRICRRGLSRKGGLAEGQGGARACALAGQRNARRVRRAEAGVPDEFPPGPSGRLR